MKIHYFNEACPDTDDVQLGMAKHQGYVPQTCLLGGATVMDEINKGRNPCDGCEGPRSRCKGSPKKQ